MMFNAETESPADVVNKSASVLSFLADMMTGRECDESITIGPEGTNGLFFILSEVSAALETAAKRV